MKKKFFFAAMALVALASCSSDDLVGENSNSPNPNPAPASGEKAIVFNSGARTVTRATLTGATAAELLKDNFVFSGIKGNGSTNPTTYVFDHYTAKFVTNTANTTESNSSDWEYVGYSPTSPSTLTASTQSIKYWDYSTTQYDFAAYSLGKGTGGASATYATATAMSKNYSNVLSYTLEGTADQLKACYISDLVTAYNRNPENDYGKVVTFSFRSLATKIRLAFFETVPGYSVKDVQFYSEASGGTAGDTPTLIASSATLPTGSGTMTISFPTTGFNNRPGGSNANTNYNKAKVSFEPSSTGTNTSQILELEALANFANAEANEGSLASGGWIGRASNAPTYAGGIDGTTHSGKYYTILPNEELDANVDASTKLSNLTLRIKYTLVSTDGSHETITVDDAKAVIPKQLANWHPNYAYTYLFKISDMTNGYTGNGPDGNPVYGLTPITLNAVVVDSEDGIQETITTVSEPSITTYAKGEIVTIHDEYTAGSNIYVVVNKEGTNQTLTIPNQPSVAGNAKLYTVTNASTINKITEETVENALRYGVKGGTANAATGTGATYTVTDAETGTFTLTDATSSLTASDKIPAADSPTGDDVTVPCAKFTPSAGIYVFEYIITPRVDGVFAAVAPTKLDASTTYYTFNGSSYVALSSVTGNEIVTAENLYFTESGGVYTAVTPTKLTPGATYYTSNGRGGHGEFKASGNEIVDAENKYYTASTAPSAGEYMYKIIRVGQQ